MVYGIYNIYNYSPWGLNQQTYQTSHLGAPPRLGLPLGGMDQQNAGSV